MGRPPSQGLTFFPLMCDTDAKEEAIQAEFGNDGLGVYLGIWRLCYKNGNGELDLSEGWMVRAAASKCNVSTAKFRKILAKCLEINLFSAEEFSEKKIVTSSGIKKRLQKVDAKREAARLAKSSQKDKKHNSSLGNNPSNNPTNNETNNSETTPETTPEIKIKIKTNTNSIGGEASEDETARRKREDAEARARFVPPSLGEVVAYFRENKYLDPDNEGAKFWNYYENGGWRVGNKRIRMKDWHLAASNWNIKNKQDGRFAYGTAAPKFKGQQPPPPRPEYYNAEEEMRKLREAGGLTAAEFKALYGEDALDDTEPENLMEGL